MRIPRPWLRKSTGTWYVQINGHQYGLGKDKRLAMKRYHELMANKPDPENYSVKEVLEFYWGWAQDNLKPTTCSRRGPLLKRFGEHVGRLKVASLKPHHVLDWLGTGLSPSTRRSRIALVKGVLNWAVAMGYITKNPVAQMRAPKDRIRQEYVPADLWPKVLEAATDEPLKDFLKVMLLSGARVQEMYQFGAEHFDGKRLVLPIEDSKGERQSRVVYLPDEALKIVKRLVKRYPKGKLFRNSKGRPWNKDSVNCRFRRLKRILKMPKLCPTVLRHSFAHHRLSSGQDALTVAKLMGHVDTRMVATRYGHLDANTEYMQAAANQIAFPSASQDDSPSQKA